MDLIEPEPRMHPALIEVVAMDLTEWCALVEPEAGGDPLTYAYGQCLNTAVALRRALSQRDHPQLYTQPRPKTLADLMATVGDLARMRHDPPPEEPGPDGLWNAYRDALMLACSLRFELCDRQGLTCEHTAAAPTL